MARAKQRLFLKAEGDGHIGFVGCVHDEKGGAHYKWGLCSLPEEWERCLRERKQNIQGYEMMAPACALASIFESDGGRPAGWENVKRVIFYVDNLGAVSCLRRGTGKFEDHCRVAGCFAYYNHSLKLDTEMFWTKSERNVADTPSRIDDTQAEVARYEWYRVNLKEQLTARWPPTKWGVPHTPPRGYSSPICLFEDLPRCLVLAHPSQWGRTSYSSD